MSAVAKRYAEALLAFATEAKVLDELGDDLKGVQSLLSASEELEAFLTHPLLSPEVQETCLKRLFKGKLQKVTLDFLILLVRRERLADFPDILPVALHLWREAKGILPVQVTSAQELTAAQSSSLETKLSGRTGKTIELTCRIDPDLLGGFRLQFGGVVEDYSLATKLQTFKRNVLNA
jgi:F-type H+-transporting ATPase subunit delta